MFLGFLILIWLCTVLSSCWHWTKTVQLGARKPKHALWVYHCKKHISDDCVLTLNRGVPEPPEIWSFFFSNTSYSNIPSLFISVFPKSLINERWDRRASEERHKFQDYSCNPDVLVNVLIYTTWERERRERSKADRESYLDPFQIWNEPRLPPTRWLEPAEEVIWTEADKRGIG